MITTSDPAVPALAAPGSGSSTNTSFSVRSTTPFAAVEHIHVPISAPGIPDRRRTLHLPLGDRSRSEIRLGKAQNTEKIVPVRTCDHGRHRRRDQIVQRRDDSRGRGAFNQALEASKRGVTLLTVPQLDSFEDAPDTPRAAPSSKDTDAAPNGFLPDTLEVHHTIDQKEKSEQPDASPAVAERASPKPRPLSQRLNSPPGKQTHRRSASAARFPVHVHDSTLDRSVSTTPVTSGRQSPVKGLSGDLAPVGFPPPPHAPEPANVEQPARKTISSGGFGALLGRMGSIRKTALSPPSGRLDTTRRSERSNTASSQDTPTLATIADGPEGGEAVQRPSLQDRFRTLREQGEHHEEETGASALDPSDASKIAPTQARHGATDATTPGSPIKENGDFRHTRASSVSTSLLSPPINPSLPPGTASGMSAGPADQPVPVDWDLWQSVVCEGPAAVARTDGEELSKAIASGIPAAIRGVVWQVLADSKSEELESMYKTLKARGTDSDLKPPPMPRMDSEASNPTPAEKESVPSSRASMHSDSSSDPVASSITTPPASIEGNASELQNKLLAERQKREAAALQKLEKTIRRDLGARTSYSKYTQSAGLQEGLFGVCKAYALFDTTIGYAQGINFIAMPLLFNMSEEEAFALLVRMMHHYHVRTLFEPEMPGLHLRLYQFERLLEDHEPGLHCHLKRRHVSPQLYATQWFLTLFAYRFPLQLVLRVYDLLFSEGLTAILKFGIVLMQRNREALLEMRDMSHLTTFLKERLFDVYIDKAPSASSLLDSGFFGSVTGGADKELYRADEMVRDASQIKITDETLQSYEAEWEETRRADREREAELETLRTTNAGLAGKVKTLEERVQQHDTEHVNIASDLVKYKVENDALHDAKEALEMQVQELQKVVDTQGAEVEEKLRGEMERIMQRNLEVQNENRSLQDDLAEAEHRLVSMSMTHAQVCLTSALLFARISRDDTLTLRIDARGFRGSQAEVEWCAGTHEQVRVIRSVRRQDLNISRTPREYRIDDAI